MGGNGSSMCWWQRARARRQGHGWCSPIGEAKAGETVGTGRLTDLERVRAALGVRATHATLLLFAPAFTPELMAVAGRRPDVELVDLDRLHHGS